ncbi:hypothetical protein GCM10022222_72530 [Amycolatopsis ultiminotia]|uniref:Uncharacterized protein n=1 Tax=Amycolatopsis ultiminotia TaxID=543629 RepID=A0ABP6Y4N5_9PSEU
MLKADTQADQAPMVPPPGCAPFNPHRQHAIPPSKHPPRTKAPSPRNALAKPKQ